MIRVQASMWKSSVCLAAALFSACGQEGTISPATSTPTSSTASVYEALSASLQACADDKADCVTAAASDATELAACDTAEQACEQKTQGTAADARRRFCDDAESCVRDNHCSDDDAGVDQADCRPRIHECVGRSAPAAPACVSTLFDCLDATGIRQSNAQTQLDAATRDAIIACVDAAHSCAISDMASGRGGRGGPGNGGGRPSFAGAGGHDGHAFAGSAANGGGRRGFPGAGGRDGHAFAGSAANAAGSAANAAGAPASAADAGAAGDDAGAGQGRGRGRGRDENAAGAAGGN